MNLAVLIPDGAGVRNFLLGSFLRHLTRLAPVTVFHQIPAELIGYYESPDAPVAWETLSPATDSRFTLILRNVLAFAHMHWANTASMRYALGLKFGGSWRTRAAMHTARSLGRLTASQGWIRRLERWHAALLGGSAGVARYRRIFQESQTTLVFCSNQRAAAAVPAVLAARDLGIPTVAFIFSWDNLSSKGRIAVPFDYYLVWSEMMAAELTRYYPDVSRDRIIIAGTPQFDPYREPALLWTRDEFFRRIGGDPSRPLICYSGGDRSIYPVEDQFVHILLEAIRTGEITGQPQVLLRPSPVDDGGRYAALRADYPELIYCPADWVHADPGNWTRVLPRREDVQLLANLTHHADLNVNLASTMTLDFAIHDKPVVNVAFDPVLPPPLGGPLGELYYRFEHYQPVVALGAARLAGSRSDLIEQVNASLRDPATGRDNRRRFVELELDGAIGGSGARAAAALAQIERDRRSPLKAGKRTPLDRAAFAETASPTS